MVRPRPAVPQRRSAQKRSRRSKEPAAASWLPRRARQFERQGNLKHAADTYRVAIALDPGKGLWHFRLGVVEASLGHWRNAVDALQAAISRDDSRAAWHFELACAHAAAGDHVRAVAAGEQALALAGGRATWRGWLACLHSVHGDWGAAQIHYTAAVTTEPNCAQWVYGLACAYDQLHDPRALGTLERAISIDGDHAEWHFRLGLLHEAAGNLEAAAHAYSGAIARDNACPLWLYRAALVAEALGRDSDALPLFRGAVSDPSAPAEWLVRASKAAERADQLAVARAALTRAIALEPRRGTWHVRLGQIEEARRDLPCAEAAFREALRIDPERLDWHRHLVRTLVAQSKDSEAKQATQAALPLHAVAARRGDHRSGVAWARALHDTGHHEDALQVLMETTARTGAGRDAVKLLWEVGNAVGDVGNVRLALHAVQSAKRAGKFAATLTRMYLQLCANFAYFEDEALELAREARTPACTDHSTKQAALDIHFFFYGPTDDLVVESLAILDGASGFSARATLNLASMLFRLERYEQLCRLYERFPQLVAYCGDTPAIAYAAMNTGAPSAGPEEQAAARETLAAYESVCRAENEIWGRLGDGHSSLAIVGNSECQLGQGRGSEIDSHDLVVRFNNFSLDPPFAQDYGTKVDVHVRVGEDSPKFDIPNPPTDVVISAVRLLDRFNRWRVIRRLLARGHRVATYPSRHQDALIHKLRRVPSAGLLTTFVATDLRKDEGRTSYYGFSFLDQTGSEPKSAHYFEKSSPSGRHEWPKEARLFAEITGRDASRRNEVVADFRKPRIKLLGDHSTYHAGCAAVIDYLSNEARSAGSLTTYDDYDVLIVNGEGSMHDDAPNFQSKMSALAEAVGRGRKAFLINTVWQNNGAEYDHVLRHLDGIFVREQASHDDLLQRHGVQSTIRIDVSYWAAVDDSASFRDLKGSVAVGDFYSEEFGNFVRLTGGTLKNRPYLDMSQTSWSSLVRTLRTSSLLITGRHHAVFAASRARTPFVALRGNTHKIEGLIKMSGLPIPICQSPDDLKDAIQWAKGNKAVFEEFFSWMDNQPRLSLPDILEASGQR